MDDFPFDVATGDLEACQIIIELSMGITLKSIRWKEGQKVVHNLPGKIADLLDEEEDRISAICQAAKLCGPECDCGDGRDV